MFDPSALRCKAALYLRLIRFDKPIGTLLLLWPTLWALWIAADGAPGWHLATVFIAGTFLTRSAGCIINDYADRDIDRFVQRTRERPLTSGALSATEALTFMAVLLLLAALLVSTTNRLTVAFAFVGVALAAVYPFMKRCTDAPQLFLGLAFSWGIPMAFAACVNQVPPFAWWLFCGNILWVLVYDTIYAMVDREDDLRIGVKSTAILFGKADRFIVGVLQLAFTAALAVTGCLLEAGVFYYGAVAAIAALFVYQQYLIKDRLPARCLRAFLCNNYVGMAMFAGVWLRFL